MNAVYIYGQEGVVIYKFSGQSGRNFTLLRLNQLVSVFQRTRCLRTISTQHHRV